jgi:hypothetical protein
MTELDQFITNAYNSEGKSEDVNKFYLALLKTPLFLPVKRRSLSEMPEEEAFSPLFAKIDDQFFMSAFDSLDRLKAWAGDHFQEIDYVELLGREIISGINENVYLCLNVGTSCYKEFSPDEVKHLKKIVARIEQLKES